LRDPPVDEQFALVVIPFRTLLHMQTDADRRAALRAVRARLNEDGCFVFDVFTPGADDIAETHGRWLEREPGIFERADWDTAERTLTLSVRDDERASTMTLAWLDPEEWYTLLEETGFEVLACYGWFDRRPYAGGEDTVWIAHAPS
jgi:SAM-dependent methyltransferase